ncbi:MAG: hypothetical protein A3F94_01205 [Candidatus Spechtbacteria bacterium RIFCSPLOWO2_12_FULL_38_22]|uniref:Adenylate kinase n=1 Tax=Candidatus Spechtbacteria bacterium RIFCSPLOWO2_12_FULL_38_22 TaxID=1802165 RepID=A0A1G2HIY2_9BACT|nr:MAG: hypothetical protein A3E58_02845 [Candidatus Spechtbacteria bacterium RIFCSPHIGHO2_12_FULL_38_30]OGZ60488.1 MAG: hypothetical protein A3A00_00885 [Candidatus Spechtbacteria bacterium RIFCSPLOWO2_01_FULL_38_20]OGZ62181.1 MAG: hypothetical protein A3F94_01205 [Candidatus Spechtbacteria bacterium RIFCSPLOWO2_12_FULL_38_22]
MNKPKNVILIGRSGSGKGTQAELLQKKFGYFYSVRTGDWFRKLAKTDSDVGKKVKEILDSGGLPYDDLATTLWMHDLVFNLRKEHGILADGFPRRVNEAKNLDSFLEFLGRSHNTFYLYLEISFDEGMRRLLGRKRYDDNKKAIEGRMEFFEKRVTPVVEYYKKQGKLIVINGEQRPEKINQDILKVIS